MISISRRISIFLIIVISSGLTVGGAFLYFGALQKHAKQGAERAYVAYQELNVKIETLLSERSQGDETPLPGFKLYRNEQFGFEFQYPEDWEVRENDVSSPYSKFNIIFMPSGNVPVLYPMVLNIVTSDFAVRSYQDIDPIDENVVVDGVRGREYEYLSEGNYYTDILLPFQEDVLILGAVKEYETPFNGVIASFRFING